MKSSRRLFIIETFNDWYVRTTLKVKENKPISFGLWIKWLDIAFIFQIVVGVTCVTPLNFCTYKMSLVDGVPVYCIHE